MSARGKKKGAKKKTISWKCAWCPQTKGQQKRGPHGPKTLCGKCNLRWGRGETGPRSDDWECDWCGVEETTRRCKDLCATCHARRSNGATGPSAKNWRCDWCAETTGRRRPGPKGPETLCQPCGGRFINGKTGPLSATFECRWCDATSTPRRYPGPSGEGELCVSCGNSYNQASDKIKARLVHVESELDRLTSVPVFDVDAGTETRGPAPKRARGGDDAAPVSALKALEAARDATAVDLGRVKRERDEAQDRNECIVCMDCPRAVLFLPCNHFVVCAACATDTCPFCNGAVASRITIANSS